MYAAPIDDFMEVEIEHRTRWEKPLELIFFDPSRMRGDKAADARTAAYGWNSTASSGRFRGVFDEIYDIFTRQFPGLDPREHPNLIFVPQRRDGVTDLHRMLASLLPDQTLQAAGLERESSNFGLMVCPSCQFPRGYAATVNAAFTQYIWTRVGATARLNSKWFSKGSPLRLLAGDTKMWMNRVYRVAQTRRAALKEDPLALQGEPPAKVFKQYAKIFKRSLNEITIHLPRTGGDLWDIDNAESREGIIDEALDGAQVQDSLTPVIELLHTQRAHEDFSACHSWIKEDFERHFYHKRNKLTVELAETVDPFVTWPRSDPDGFSEVSIRDMFAALNLKERKLLLALRFQTVGEIAHARKLNGHAAISRQVQNLRRKVTQLLT